ncbi:hypothetical protein F4803DRAFT_574315 [Xylaria telfairii]|nr:hypothetical protein F4803DRAFT_574315 [Xylaria telfairii]
MGGKIWSAAEERYFWRVAVRQSTKRVGIDLAKRGKSWDRLAADMQRAMGDSARRQYTGVMLFEHFFQNTEIQRRSPNAYVYVQEYLNKRDRSNSPVNNRLVGKHSINDHPIKNKNDLGSSSTSIPRRSQYVSFVTEPDATRYPQHPHQVPNNENPSNAISYFASPVTSSPTFYGAYGALDLTEASINTSNLICLREYGESGLEEGEIRK